MIRILDLAKLGPALGQVREMLGMTRRQCARVIVAATGRTESSVNSQLWTWDAGTSKPALESLAPYLKVLGVEVALVFVSEPCDPQLAAVIRMARRELDQPHPWIPGGVFRDDERLKPLLLAFLDSLVPAGGD